MSDIEKTVQELFQKAAVNAGFYLVHMVATVCKKEHEAEDDSHTLVNAFARLKSAEALLLQLASDRNLGGSIPIGAIKNVSEKTTLATCLVTEIISEKTLREYYPGVFTDAELSDIKMKMETGYTKSEGVHAAANLEETLRKIRKDKG